MQTKSPQNQQLHPAQGGSREGPYYHDDNKKPTSSLIYANNEVLPCEHSNPLIMFWSDGQIWMKSISQRFTTFLSIGKLVSLGKSDLLRCSSYLDWVTRESVKEGRWSLSSRISSPRNRDLGSGFLQDFQERPAVLQEDPDLARLRPDRQDWGCRLRPSLCHTASHPDPPRPLHCPQT